MTDKKRYLGDGVYVDIDQWDGTLLLTTEDGIRVTNMISIDASVWRLLVSYVERMSKPEAKGGRDE